MLFVLLFATSWFAFFVLGETRKFTQIYATSLIAIILGLITDVIIHTYTLWAYSDKRLSQPIIMLLNDFGVYPVVTYLFIQGVPLRFKAWVTYTWKWSIGVIVLEAIVWMTGHIEYRLWWNIALSYLADWIIFGILTLHYRWNGLTLARNK